MPARCLYDDKASVSVFVHGDMMSVALFLRSILAKNPSPSSSMTTNNSSCGKGDQCDEDDYNDVMSVKPRRGARHQYGARHSLPLARNRSRMSKLQTTRRSKFSASFDTAANRSVLYFGLHVTSVTTIFFFFCNFTFNPTFLVFSIQPFNARTYFLSHAYLSD